MLIYALLLTNVAASKFIHISGIHFDPLYLPHSSNSEVCHRRTGRAGKYGTIVEYLNAPDGCDSPKSLLDLTFTFINKNLSNNMDFIIWTGDNSRHDFDKNIPRTSHEIAAINDFVARHYFLPLSFKITVIPSIGNHDLLCLEKEPLLVGPNRTCEALYNSWKAFIPIRSIYSFLLYGSYFVEVKKSIYVFSVNTIYFFILNQVPDCEAVEAPGAKLLHWLDENLGLIAEQKGKVFISGHVPPIQPFYKPKCLEKFLELLQKYHQIIHGQFYGHLHTDEFNVQLDSNNEPFGVAFMCPSLRPSHNPGFRLYEYEPLMERDDIILKDYSQFILNLTSKPPPQGMLKQNFSNLAECIARPKVSKQNVISLKLPSFSLEYSFLSTYSLNSMKSTHSESKSKVAENQWLACIKDTKLPAPFKFDTNALFKKRVCFSYSFESDWSI